MGKTYKQTNYNEKTINIKKRQNINRELKENSKKQFEREIQKYLNKQENNVKKIKYFIVI